MAKQHVPTYKIPFRNTEADFQDIVALWDACGFDRPVDATVDQRGDYTYVTATAQHSTYPMSYKATIRYLGDGVAAR